MIFITHIVKINL